MLMQSRDGLVLDRARRRKWIGGRAFL